MLWRCRLRKVCIWRYTGDTPIRFRFSARNIRLITWRSQVQILPPQPDIKIYQLFNQAQSFGIASFFAFWIYCLWRYSGDTSSGFRNKSDPHGLPLETMFITQISQQIDNYVTSPPLNFRETNIYKKILTRVNCFYTFNCFSFGFFMLFANFGN